MTSLWGGSAVGLLPEEPKFPFSGLAQKSGLRYNIRHSGCKTVEAPRQTLPSVPTRPQSGNLGKLPDTLNSYPKQPINPAKLHPHIFIVSITTIGETMDSSHYRKIELQSAADFTYLHGNTVALSRQKLDLHLPPSAAPNNGPDPMRERVRELVDDVYTPTPLLPLIS